MNAFATIEQLPSTIINNRRVLRACVSIETQSQWLGFATVFGFTPGELQTAAYMEADRRAEAHGLTLQSLRAA